MRQAAPQQYLAADPRALAARDGVEWEELPSLADSLAERLNSGPADPASQREAARRFTAAWDNTLPAQLDALPPEPFCEPMRGLAVREVKEPEIFRLFFGPAARR